jgi:hypothetical protein
MKAWNVAVLASLAWSLASAAQEARPLPPPPFQPFRTKGFERWTVEHVAFTQGHTGKPVGGPARWAVGGCLPYAAYPIDQAGRLCTGQRASDTRIYFSDQRRRFWVLEKGEVWPIAGTDDLGQEDGPATHARFIYSGVYGGHHDGMAAVGTTVYVADHGRLRRIRRRRDGAWEVETVAGAGTKALRPGRPARLRELSTIGKGLTLDAAGNLYFTLSGGLVRASPDGAVAWLITPEKVHADMAAVYRRKWPDAKPPRLALGVGEGVALLAGPDGAIYGGGRTWPSAWKVTADGQFAPLVNYAPKGKLMSARWGPGDPACYQPHCSMGMGITTGGLVWFQNEIPFARTRYEKDRVTVLKKDLTWGLLPADSKDFFVPPDAMKLNSDNTMAEGNAPGPFHSRSAYIRLRRPTRGGQR